MKQGARAIAIGLSLAAPACASWFGAGGGSEEPPAPSAPVEFALVPEWVRPAQRDLARSPELREAVAMIEDHSPVSAAIRLQQLRSREAWGPEVAALHSWVLIEAGTADDARRVALEGMAEHGAGGIALNYALGVAEEVGGRQREALAAYARAAEAAPADATLREACARTALAAGDPATALAHLERLPAEGDDPRRMRLRAAALGGAGRGAEAVAAWERLARALPGDLEALDRAVAGVDAAASPELAPEALARARALADALAEADPQHADAHWIAGRLAALAGDGGSAERSLRRVLEIDPARIEAGELLAGLLLGAGRADEARVVLFDLLRQPLSRQEVEAVQRRILDLERAE